MKGKEDRERRANAKSKLSERLHNPAQLRIIITAAVLLVGYAAIYTPLSQRIDDTTRKLSAAKKLVALASSVDQSRAEFAKLKSRLPQQTDSKEWVQYVLDGLRQFPLKMVSLNCHEPRDLGAYKAVEMKIELCGSFSDMDRFLNWLETNQRLFRVDELRIAPVQGKSSGMLSMQLRVLGVMG